MVTPTGLTKGPAGAGVGITDRAARSLWRGDLLTAGQQLALDLLTECHAALAHADATRLWPPQLILLVPFSIHSAAITFLCIHD